MRARAGWLGVLALVLAAAIGPTARADIIELSVRIVDEQGGPHAAMPTRLVVGSEPSSRRADAGARLIADADGRVSRTLEATIERRWSTGDYLVPRRLDTLSVGIELDLVGRRALYWVRLTDHGRRGASIGIETFVQGRDGTFDAPLRHVPPASWQFPDQPGGLLMSDIGVKPRSWNLESDTLADGRRRWRATIELTKQVFARR
ncbi:MAG: hypothetical protein KF889_08580 [Alphaproteobacteria bacterium]|nr:hypothetical protein [Alphaproteobacteria bacterium]MCW5740876.1 hypothetical protein [Alphaproteobacteria bacterium]